ncbi:menaquinone biosynthesis protein [Shimazuella sp. AN120528]|uniref:menaquinone biosynthesis protein n=1 Tax=Shimazuella soli TaxID=1892854 RepID=UPI001F0E33C1|nr:menaquinone biosynthesis protein [Shimazuella soli]MCH5586456.1 menaquinone biosynthesis protein [Shimazuella soli]
MKLIRIGKIAFTNILPLYHYFHFSDLSVELIPQVPSKLNQSMADGRIDMGPISSFAYAHDYPKYVIMPDISVSAKGPVGSIFLFSKKDEFSAVKDGKIALTNTSATSIHLLKILLEHFANGSPSYTTQEPNLDKMMEVADAALLIGDDALRANWSNTKYYVFDLGLQWYKETGLPMTFAVWAVNRRVAEERQEMLSLIYQRFLQAKKLGQQEPIPVIQEARRQLGGEVADWKKYYAGLNYNFGPEEQRGLATYFHYAKLTGLIKDEVKIEVLDLPVHI